MPAFCAMLPVPFQLGGPQMLDSAAAPITPAALDTANFWLPSGWRAVNVLTSACFVRGQKPCACEAK